MSVTIRVENELPRLMTQIGTNMRTLPQMSAQRMTATAKARVPKDTGSLEDTIEAQPYPEMGVNAWAVLAGDTEGGYRGKEGGKKAGEPVDYALAQEYGGPHNTAHSFMTASAEGEWPRLQEQAVSAIQGVL